MATGLSSLSSKKLPSFNINGSSSSKHIYDGVFSSPSQNKLKSSEFSSFCGNDYAEIFGSSKFDNGPWKSSCSSIPILDLPVSEQRILGSRGGIDYSDVFGGGGDERFAVDGEDLFDQSKKKANTSSAPIPRSKGHTKEATKSDISSQSQNDQAPMNGFAKSFDSVNHLHQNIEMLSHETKGPTCVAHFRALHEVGSSQKTQTKRGKHSKHTSSDLGVIEPKSEHDAGFLQASGSSESNSATRSHATHQPVDETNSATHVVDVNSIPGSIYSEPEVGPSQKTETSRTPVMSADTELGMDVHLAKKGEHSRNTSSGHGANEEKNGDGAGFQKAPGLSESNSSEPSKMVKDNPEMDFHVKDDIRVEGSSDFVANKHDNEDDASSQQAPSSSGSKPTEAVKDDAELATAFDVGKKQGRHSRMTSLDLGGNRHARDRDAKYQRKSRSGGSYSFDASHDPFASRIKVQPSKVVPSSSLPQFFPIESYCQISENSNCKSCENSSSPPSLDEQLDINSDAAVSVAALQRALEEAEIRIRLAKEFLVREGQGSTKLSFKDTLKAKVMKENKHIEDNVMQTCSHSERESVLQTAHFVPVVEDPIEGENAKASESIEEGDKHEGGGEWEAAKHLNQLISGVKNRIASFMAWQAEAEKKEEPKESEEGECQLKKTESATVFSSGTKLGEEDKVGLIPEANELEENESTRSNHKVEDLMPDIEGPTTTNFLFFTFNSEKLLNRPHLEVGKEEAQESGEQGSENREELVDEAKAEEENREGLEDICMSRDCGESPIGVSNEGSDEIEEELYSIAEHERSELTHEEEHRDERSRLTDEEDNNNSMNEECGSDMIELPQEENGHRRVNEEFRHSRSESTHEEDNERRVSEEFGDDRRKFTDEEDNDRRVNTEFGDDRSELTDEEDNDRRVNEEFGDDRRKFTDEEDNVRRVNAEFGDDRRVNEEFGDDRRVSEEFGDDGRVSEEFGDDRRVTAEFRDDRRKFTDEEDNERRVNEEFGDERRKFTDEEDNDRRVNEEFGDDRRKFTDEEDIIRVNEDNVEEAMDNSHCHEDIIERIDDEGHEYRVVKEAEATEEISGRMNGWEEDKRYEKQSNHTEETAMETENEVLSKAAEDCGIDGINPAVEETVFPDEDSEIVLEIADYSSDSEMDGETTQLPDDESEKKMDTSDPSSEPEMEIENLGEERVLKSVSTEIAVNFDGIEYLDCTNRALPCEDSVLHECETDLNSGKKDEPESEGILGNQPKHLHVSGKTLNDQEEEKCSVEAVHRRRRWFENGEKVDAVEQPGILEGEKTHLATDQEVLEEPDLAGSVEIHADKLDSDTALKQKDSQVNVEATHKRRRWFVKTGEEGVPEPPSLFEGIKVTSLPHNMSDGSIDQLSTESGEGKQNVEATPRRKRWFESVEKVGPAQQPRTSEDAGTTVDSEKCVKLDNMHVLEGKDDNVHNKVEPVNEIHRDLDEVKKRKKEKQKERIAVERAIREARERAFAEARERARRDAVERPNTEVCQKMGSGKVSAEPSSSSSDKASMEAKLRAERAAVERATAEARERALQRALSEKTSQRSRELSGRHPTERSSSLDPKYHNSSSYSRCSDSLDKDEEFNGMDGESAQRRKARLERQKRTMERAAKALEEKNKLDLLAQKEQAARNMFADALDAEVKRWSSGKEGNLRTLLSTLQYILGSDSGWQAISLTDLVAPTAVRKAYKKANLCVHPDKLQQRGANIQQKYVCEKVFDLLKDAWSKFNPDER